jgi:hypothetical protein
MFYNPLENAITHIKTMALSLKILTALIKYSFEMFMMLKYSITWFRRGF